MAQIKILKFIDPNGKVFGWKQTGNEPHALMKGYTGTTYQFPRIDKSTFAFEGIDVAHYEIHGGNCFVIHHYEADFDKAENFGILFKTPNTTEWLHMFPIVYAGTAALFEICEAPTIDAGNYPTVFYTPINRNRNSTKTSAVSSIRGTPVVNQASLKRPADNAPITADGTIIHAEMLGSSKQGGGSGGRDNNEYVLKQNTIYYFRLSGTAGGVDNSVGSITLTWYAHVDKE